MNESPQAYLSKLPHFAFFSEDKLKTIAEACTFENYPEGFVYAIQGESRVDHVFAVSEGSISLYDQWDGDKKLIGYIKPGEIFGGITILLNGGISLRTVIVDRSCSGYTIPGELFQKLCAENKRFHEYFLENFSKHIFDPALSAIIETGQTRHFLAGLDPFSFLPAEEIDWIASRLSVVHYPKDTVLFAQGRTRIGYLYILQRGSAERYFEEGRKKTMSDMLGEGDLYGGISILLNDGISVRTLQVKEDSYFYLLPKKHFLEVCSRHEEFTEYFTDIFGKRMLEKSYAGIIAQTARPQEDELLFFNQPVSNLYSPDPVFGDSGLTIQETAAIMQRKNISAVFIRNPAGKCTGIVTERDLTNKVVAAGYDAMRPVADIMSAPVRSVSDESLVFEALMIMMQDDIRHLAVAGADGRIVGVLSSRDLMAAQGQSPLFLLRQISEAEDMDGIVERHNQLPSMVRSLITSGAQAGNVTRFITAVSDAILEKLISYVMDEVGPPPARFAFLMLGSEGRREQTLKTDQDNAIVYEEGSGESGDAVQDYFLEFGRRVCTLLDRAGYAFCTGNVMAQNPQWCQPLAVWKQNFSSWIHAAEPEDLLQASIFFDFRIGYGDPDIVEELRTHLFDSLQGWSGFFRHLTINTLHFKLPIGFFRNFVVESKGKHRDAFDIKGAMAPIVDFARIYALKHKIGETNTLERLKHLSLQKVLPPEDYEELEKAYSFLLQLRFARQVTMTVDEKRSPDNYIYPKKMTGIEQKMLKEIFRRIEKFQTKLEFEFIGIV